MVGVAFVAPVVTGFVVYLVVGALRDAYDALPFVVALLLYRLILLHGVRMAGTHSASWRGKTNN